MSTSPLKHAVFLDRDGVLTRSIIREGKAYAPRSLDEFEILPGVERALAQLKKAEFALFVVTNQPDVSTGLSTLALIQEMHRRMSTVLPIDGFEVCTHLDGDDCLCRKPKPGLILQAARREGISLATSYMIGDRWRDTEAGVAAGCQTIWLRTDYLEKKPTHYDFVAEDLGEAVEWILK